MLDQISDQILFCADMCPQAFSWLLWHKLDSYVGTFALHVKSMRFSTTVLIIIYCLALRDTYINSYTITQENRAI